MFIITGIYELALSPISAVFRLAIILVEEYDYRETQRRLKRRRKNTDRINHNRLGV